MPDASKLSTIPVGQLGILPLESCCNLGKKVDKYLVKWRKARLVKEPKESIIFDGYEQETFLLKSDCPRFASGEGCTVVVLLSLPPPMLILIVSAFCA